MVTKQLHWRPHLKTMAATWKPTFKNKSTRSIHQIIITIQCLIELWHPALLKFSLRQISKRLLIMPLSLQRAVILKSLMPTFWIKSGIILNQDLPPKHSTHKGNWVQQVAEMLLLVLERQLIYQVWRLIRAVLTLNKLKSSQTWNMHLTISNFSTLQTLQETAKNLLCEPHLFKLTVLMLSSNTP